MTNRKIEYWGIPPETDGEFAAKMEEVLETYAKPYDSTRQCFARRRIGDLKSLREQIRAWSTDVNRTQRGVDSQMKISDAHCKLKSVYLKV